MECNSTESEVSTDSTDSRALERGTIVNTLMRRFVRGSICSVPFVEAAFQFQRAAWLTPMAPTGVIARRTVKKALVCALFSDLLLDTRMHSALGLILALVVMVVASALAAAWEPLRVKILQYRAPGKPAFRRLLYAVLLLEIITDPRIHRAAFAFLSFVLFLLLYFGLSAACTRLLYVLRPHAWWLQSFIVSVRQLCLEQATRRRIMSVIAADEQNVSTGMWNSTGISVSVSTLSVAESPMVVKGSKVFLESLSAVRCCISAAASALSIAESPVVIAESPMVVKGCKVFKESLRLVRHCASSLAHKTSALIKSLGVPKVSRDSILAQACVVLLGKGRTMMGDMCSVVCSFAAKAPTQRKGRRRSCTPERRKSQETGALEVEASSVVGQAEVASLVIEATKKHGVQSMLWNKGLQVVRVVKKIDAFLGMRLSF